MFIVTIELGSKILFNFELKEQAVVVSSNTNSYIHINIDLSNLASPVFVTVETQDNSNSVDINSNSGILKKCIENVRTNASSISDVTKITYSISNNSEVV